MSTEIDGWDYSSGPSEGGDARKLVTLQQEGMTWVGIRAFNHANRRWLNNGEPELAKVVAWRDLESPRSWVLGQRNTDDRREYSPPRAVRRGEGGNIDVAGSCTGNSRSANRGAAMVRQPTGAISNPTSERVCDRSAN